MIRHLASSVLIPLVLATSLQAQEEITIQPLDDDFGTLTPGDGIGTLQPVDDDFGTLTLGNPGSVTGEGTGFFNYDDLQVLPQGMQRALSDIKTEIREVVAASDTAVLRALDKVSGDVTDFELAVGDTATLGRINVTLGGCRYPVETPASNAYTYLVIRNVGQEAPVFAGWMLAASPALNALDHPRYDVWALRCKIPAAD
jgi:hypothetical protein